MRVSQVTTVVLLHLPVTTQLLVNALAIPAAPSYSSPQVRALTCACTAHRMSAHLPFPGNVQHGCRDVHAHPGVTHVCQGLPAEAAAAANVQQ